MITNIYLRAAFFYAAIILGVYAPAKCESVTFKFSPEDGLNYEFSYKHSTKENLLSTSLEFVSSVRGRDSFSVSPRGIVLRRVYDEHELRQSGDVVDHPLSALTRAYALVHYIEPNGHLKRMATERRPEQLVPPSVPALGKRTLDTMLDPKALMAKRAPEWNGDVAAFHGETIVLNEPFSANAAIMLRQAAIAVEAEGIAVRAAEQRPGRTMLRINLRSTKLNNQLRQYLTSLIRRSRVPQLDFADITFLFDREIVVDASTLLLFSKSDSLTISAQLVLPNSDRYPFELKVESAFKIIENSLTY